MTRTQKIQLRQAALRQKLNELMDTSPETRAESFESDLQKVTNELRSSETELQAALLTEPETRHDAPEALELRSMLNRADLSNIFEAALGRSRIDGVERELQEHYGIDGNSVPLAMLETRAVTPAPANVGTNQQPITPQVFPQSVAAFLGIDMPTVGVGEQVFPILSSGATAQTPAENVAINPDSDTGAFTADVLKGARLQTSFLYSREDRARFAGDGRRTQGEPLRRAGLRPGQGDHGRYERPPHRANLANHAGGSCDHVREVLGGLRLWPGGWQVRDLSRRPSDRHGQ